MNSKIFSLCVILFILLLCGTVAASDVDNTYNTTNTNTEVNTTNIITPVTELSVSYTNIDNSIVNTENTNIKTTSNNNIATSTATNQDVSSTIIQDNSNDDNGVISTSSKEKEISKNTESYTKSSKKIESTKQSSINQKSVTSSNQKSSTNSNTNDANSTNDAIINSVTNINTSSLLKSATIHTNNLVINGTIKTAYDKKTDVYAGEYDDSFNAQGATIVVKDSNNNIVSNTTSDAFGNYLINGLKSGTYTVTINYGTYLSYTESIRLTNKSYSLNYTFVPDIAIISYSGVSATDGQKNKVEALRNISDRVYFIENYNLQTKDESRHWMLEYTNFILVDMYSASNGFAVSEDLISSSPACEKGMIAYTFGIYSDQYFSSVLKDWKFVGGNVNSYENTYIGSYWQAQVITDMHAVKTNMKNMFNYITYLLGETKENPTMDGNTPLLTNPDWGLYHPDYGIFGHAPTQTEINKWIRDDPGYNDDGVGSLNWMSNEYAKWNAVNNSPDALITEFENWYTNNKNITGSFIVIASYYPGGSLVDAMIKEYEAQGRAVVNIFQKSTTPSMTELLSNITTGSSALKRGVVAVNSLYSWSTDYASMGTNKTITAYDKMNIAIIRALNGISNYSYVSDYGPQTEWTYAVSVPQFEGVFGALPVSYLDSNGTEIVMTEGVKKMVQLTNGWAKLKETANQNKKIAIILYNYPPGKADIGASYLDVFQSLHDLLEQLSDAGYNIGMTKDEIPSTDELYTRLAEAGNKGTWAQGLLDSYVKKYYNQLIANGQLISKDQYMKWYNELPTSLQEALTTSWGKGLGNGSMHYTNENGTYLLIPGFTFGNVFITLQPARGWDEVTDYHSPTLAPHQQYIAFYKYLSEVFGAEAMIHMGTHGTLEWLPGHTLGMQCDDWTFQLSDIPNIYPYIVSNPGEGMTAKDRGFAMVISHMTPTTTSTTLYGDLEKLQQAIVSYRNVEKVNSTSLMDQYQNQILNLSDSLGYDGPTTNQTFNVWLNLLDHKLESLEGDTITLGLHTLGHIWNGTEMVTGVKTIASSRTDILQNLMITLYPQYANDSYYDLIKDRTFSEKKTEIDNMYGQIVTDLASGKSVADVATSYGFSNSSAIYTNIQAIATIIEQIRNNSEWTSIMNALDGGYVIPGLAADPAYADSLPTGKSIYSLDTSKMPTKAAWESAKASVDVMLKNYYESNNGAFPEVMALVIWGTELLRTEGIGVGQFLYLLGVEPTWSITGTGTVTGIKLIPLSDLKLKLSDGSVINRPRIDVFSTAVTSNKLWLKLMNDAVKLVNNQNETFLSNYVKKHYAEQPSLERIFGLQGNVLEGTGVSDLTPSVTVWQNATDGLSNALSSVYVSRLSHSWNIDENGNIVVKNATGIFSYLLSHVNLISQNVDSTWRFLDSDDYLDWYGGLLNAANTHGATPNTQIIDIRNKNEIKASTLGQEVEKEVRNTILNPEYQNKLLKTGSGWNEMASKYQNAIGVMLTTQGYKEDAKGNAVKTDGTSHNSGVLGDGIINELGKSLLSNTYTITKDSQSYAFQSMSGWILTTYMNGFWKAKDTKMVEQLANKYITTVTQYGIACCHHTCKNIVFNKWIVKVATVPNALKKQYSDIMTAATYQGAVYEEDSPTPTTTNPSDGKVVDVSTSVDGIASSQMSSTVTNIANGASQGSGTSGSGTSGVMGSSSGSQGSSTNSGSGTIANGATSGSGVTGSGTVANQNGSQSNGTQSGQGTGSQSSGTSSQTGGSGSQGTSGSSGSTNGGFGSLSSTSGSGNSGSATSGNNTNNNGDSSSDAGTDMSSTGNSASSSTASSGQSSSKASDSVTSTSGATVEASAASSEASDSQSDASGSSGKVYELSQKQKSKPAPQDSEVSAAYIMAIVLLACLFFVGFKRKSPRIRE